jgi:hypothetical protein
MGKQEITPIDYNKVIPKETAERFKIVGLKDNQSTRIVFHKIGTVDFTTLTIADAEVLIKKGATFIQEKKAKNGSGADQAGQ